MVINKLDKFKIFTNVKLLEKGNITKDDFLEDFKDILTNILGNDIEYISEMKVKDNTLQVKYLNGTEISYEIVYNASYLSEIVEHVNNIIGMTNSEESNQSPSIKQDEEQLKLNIAEILNLENYNLSNDEIKKINYNIKLLSVENSLSSLYVSYYLISHLKATYNAKGEYLDTIDYLRIISKMSKNELIGTFQNSFLYRLNLNTKELDDSGILVKDIKFEKGKNSVINYGNLSYANYVGIDSMLHVEIERPINIGGTVYSIRTSYEIDVINSDRITVTHIDKLIALNYNDRKNYIHRNKESELLYETLASSITEDSFLMSDKEFKDVQTSIEEVFVKYFNDSPVFSHFMNEYNSKLDKSISKGWLHGEIANTNILSLGLKHDVERITVNQNSKSINILKLDDDEGYLLELDSEYNVVYIVYTELDKLINAVLFISNQSLFKYSFTSLNEMLLELMELDSMQQYKDGDTFVNIPLNLNYIPITEHITLYSYHSKSEQGINIELEIEDEETLDAIYNTTFTLNNSVKYIHELKKLI